MENDGVGGEDTALEKLGDALGVGGGDPERTQGCGLGRWIGGAVSSQAPEARCQRQVVAVGGRRLVAAEW